MIYFVPMWLVGFTLLWILPLFSAPRLDHLSRPFTALPQHERPLVILDAGHGGRDEGAKVHDLLEKRIALTSTLMVRKHLEKMGYRVILTRSKDVFIPLSRRVLIANQTQAALFVSIHYNASPSQEAQGVEVFYSGKFLVKRSKDSRLLASTILHAVITQTKAVSRGVKSRDFHVIRETAMPSVLVEGGFMTNAEERARLTNRLYLEKIAKGIAQGIDTYLTSSR
ncbi:MAG: N-acetylmuramoyl-L-alanine amidase [Candidatus Rhabdochlamydia sp.]